MLVWAFFNILSTDIWVLSFVLLLLLPTLFFEVYREAQRVYTRYFPVCFVLANLGIHTSSSFGRFTFGVYTANFCTSFRMATIFGEFGYWVFYSHEMYVWRPQEQMETENAIYPGPMVGD